MGENFLEEVFPQTPFQELSIMIVFGTRICSTNRIKNYVRSLLHKVAGDRAYNVPKHSDERPDERPDACR